MYPYRTVVLNWTDPRLPGLLRPIIQENERLLKLYESGLPAWAVYFPQWGLFYRPWLRTLTWLLFYAFSGGRPGWVGRVGQVGGAGGLGWLEEGTAQRLVELPVCLERQQFDPCCLVQSHSHTC